MFIQSYRFDGTRRIDFIGLWADGVYVQYSATNDHVYSNIHRKFQFTDIRIYICNSNLLIFDNLPAASFEYAINFKFEFSCDRSPYGNGNQRFFTPQYGNGIRIGTSRYGNREYPLPYGNQKQTNPHSKLIWKLK
jgi:hypothetical protein